MKKSHVLEPGETLLRSGKWLRRDGTSGVGPCVDPERGEAEGKASKRGRPKGPPKKKGN